MGDFFKMRDFEKLWKEKKNKIESLEIRGTISQIQSGFFFQFFFLFYHTHFL